MSLTDFPLHRRGVISAIDMTDGEMLQKLIAIGALPDIAVEVLQRRPSYVLRIGHATVAVDDAIASCVRVEGIAN